MTGVDLVVANRLRALRQSRLLSVEQVAEVMGTNAQQVLRYEACQERVGAAQLVDLARLFDVPVSNFFEGLDHERQAEPPLEGSPGKQDKITNYLFESLSDPQKDALLSLVKALGKPPDDKERSHGT